MAKEKKVSITAVDKVIASTYVPTETLDWYGVELTIKRNLSFKEMVEFVNSIVNSCFAEDGTYQPEAKEFATRVLILEKYANFNMPEDSAHKYKIAYCTDAVSVILERIDYAQYSEMCRAIDARIAHRAQANIEAVHTQMNQLYSAFDSLQKQIGSIFGGVNEEDMSKLIQAMSNGGFSEEKLAESYIDKMYGSKEKTE